MDMGCKVYMKELPRQGTWFCLLLSELQMTLLLVGVDLGTSENPFWCIRRIFGLH